MGLPVGSLATDLRLEVLLGALEDVKRRGDLFFQVAVDDDEDEL